jgi:hypothetical protein
MKAGKFIVLGIFFYVAVFIYRRFNALKRIQPNIGLPKSIRFESGFLTWVQEISIQNFDNVSFEISSANLDVISNGQYVGKCGLREPQTIKANGYSIINLVCVCTVTDLIQSLAVTITDVFNSKAIDLKLDGVVGAYSIFTAPISTHVIINPSAVLSIFKKL